MRWISRVVTVVLLAGCSLYAAGELSNRRAPGFSLPDVNLAQHDLADYRGKLVLLDIMQTGCPHCKVFTKILDEVRAKYGDKVAILSVVNPPSTQATVNRYLADTNTTAPILFDCGQVAASYLRVTPKNPRINVPHVFLIDSNGWIVNDWGYGPTTKGIFEGRDLFPEVEKSLKQGSRPAGKK